MGPTDRSQPRRQAGRLPHVNCGPNLFYWAYCLPRLPPLQCTMNGSDGKSEIAPHYSLQVAVAHIAERAVAVSRQLLGTRRFGLVRSGGMLTRTSPVDSILVASDPRSTRHRLAHIGSGSELSFGSRSVHVEDARLESSREPRWNLCCVSEWNGMEPLGVSALSFGRVQVQKNLNVSSFACVRAWFRSSSCWQTTQRTAVFAPRRQ